MTAYEDNGSFQVRGTSQGGKDTRKQGKRALDQLPKLPLQCPEGARNGRTQGGSLHEKPEGLSCEFNYCLNLYKEIYLWVHI